MGRLAFHGTLPCQDRQADSGIQRGIHEIGSFLSWSRPARSHSKALREAFAKALGPAHPPQNLHPSRAGYQGAVTSRLPNSEHFAPSCLEIAEATKVGFKGGFPSPTKPALLLRCWLVSDRVSAQTVLIGWRCLPLERLTNGVVPVCTVSILLWPQGKGELPSKAVDALGPARSQSHHDSKGHFCAAQQHRPRPTARAARGRLGSGSGDSGEAGVQNLTDALYRDARELGQAYGAAASHVSGKKDAP